MFRVDPYEPIGTLKRVDDDIWIVDGPVIGMKWLWTELPFPTRMTVVRLADGSLWVHSPVALSGGLKAELGELGPVRFIVAPNRIHYWWVGEWRIVYPDAIALAAPRVEEEAGKHGISFDRELTGVPEDGWAGEIDQVLVPGRFLMRMGGVTHPHGSMPRDLRMTFRGREAEVRAAVEKMISWQPRRILLAHGRRYEENAAGELRRAFRWAGVSQRDA